MTSAVEQTRVLYIAGAMHCGSTALSCLLDQHPSLVAVSQLEWLATYAARGAASPCSCGLPVDQCPFWCSVAARLAEAGTSASKPGFQDLALDTSWLLPATDRLAYGLLLGLGSPAMLGLAGPWLQAARAGLRSARDNERLFDALCAASGKRIVVDASKLPGRGKLLYLAAPACTKIVWLVRDGRAATWSRSRRSGVTIEHAALAWVRANLEVGALLANVPATHRICVHFERVCRNPSDELARIHQFVAVPPAEFSGVLHKERAHLVGGNDMRFRRDEDALELDERWKRDLSSSELRRFNRVAGWLNRALGYVD